MPRYYFDVSDRNHNHIDDDGDDLANEQAARTYARLFLVEQAARLLRDSNAAEIVVNVRDITGPLFRGKLSASVD